MKKINNFKKIDLSFVNRIDKDKIKKIASTLTTDNIKYLYRFVIGVVVILIFILLYLVFNIFVIFKQLSQNASKLYYLSIYEGIDKEYKNGNKTIKDLIKEEVQLEKKIDDIRKKLDRYQISYNNFLKYKVLPSLNVWKQSFEGKIDLTIIGDKFTDPKYNIFMDTNLLNYWSNFFVSSYYGENNRIKDSSIGDIKVLQNNKYFNIPINMKIETPTNINFIQLINKLSQTSNKKNIMLLVELFNHLFVSIKNNLPDKYKDIVDYKTIGYWFYKGMPDKFKICIPDKYFTCLNYINVEELSDKEINKLFNIVLSKRDYMFKYLNNNEIEKINSFLKKYNNPKLSKNIKKKMKYNLIKLISEVGEIDSNKLLNQNVYLSFIKSAAYCNEVDEICIYNFRNKYKYLGFYAIDLVNGYNNFKDNLKRYVDSLGFLIDIDKFVFKRKIEGNKDNYFIDLSFRMFGRYITDKDIEEIKKAIYLSCFGVGNKDINKFEIDLVKSYLNKKLYSILNDNKSQIDSLKVYEYQTIIDLIENILKEYNGLDNYKKVIKLLEIYRMLKDNNLCIQ